MPDIPGRMKSEGYISPAPPHGAPKEVKEFMAKTYGGLRKNKYPGENKENKMRAARITWYQTKRKFGKKYPALFRKNQGKRDPPSVIKTPDFNVPTVTPAATKAGRRKQVRDLKAAAKEQREWANQAQKEETAESKRSEKFRKEGMPVRGKVLKDDAKLAKGFAKDRREVAKDLDLQAARIAAIKGD